MAFIYILLIVFLFFTGCIMFENVNSIVNEILLQKNKDAGYSALPVIFNHGLM